MSPACVLGCLNVQATIERHVADTRNFSGVSQKHFFVSRLQILLRATMFPWPNWETFRMPVACDNVARYMYPSLAWLQFTLSDHAQNANISVRYHENTTDIGHHNSLVFLCIWLRRKPKSYLILRSSILYYIEQFSQQLIRLPDLKYLPNLLITKNLGAC